MGAKISSKVRIKSVASASSREEQGAPPGVPRLQSPAPRGAAGARRAQWLCQARLSVPPGPVATARPLAPGQKAPTSQRLPRGRTTATNTHLSRDHPRPHGNRTGARPPWHLLSVPAS